MNKLKRLIWLAAGFAAVSITFALGTESRAIAQAVRAVLMRNQDEPGRNPYFESQDVICTSGACVATFPPVPAGQRLVLTYISAQCCEYGAPPTSVRMIVGNKHQQQFFMTQYDPIISTVSAPVVAYVEAGETVIVAAVAPAGDLAVTLSGYYISLP